jgi:hypothetical protein
MNEDIKNWQTCPLSNLGYCAYLLFALVFLYLRTFLLRTPVAPYGDEIHYFLHAVRMLHGQVPYRDFFTFVPPGTDLLYLGVFRLFGVHAWVVQGILVALGFFLTCSILWISSGILNGLSILLPGLLFLVFDLGSALDATHHWWCTLFVLLAVGTLLGGRNRTRLLVAGTLCGVATLFTQTQGGLSLLAIALYLVWTRPTHKAHDNRSYELIPLILPFAAIIGVFVGYYAWKIGLGTITYWTIYLPSPLLLDTGSAHSTGILSGDASDKALSRSAYCGAICIRSPDRSTHVPTLLVSALSAKAEHGGTVVAPRFVVDACWHGNVYLSGECSDSTETKCRRPSGYHSLRLVLQP